MKLEGIISKDNGNVYYTFPITILNSLNQEYQINTLAFVDTGAQHSYITTELKDNLQLVRDSFQEYPTMIGGYFQKSYSYSINLTDKHINIVGIQVLEFKQPDKFRNGCEFLVGNDFLTEYINDFNVNYKENSFCFDIKI